MSSLPTNSNPDWNEDITEHQEHVLIVGEHFTNGSNLFSKELKAQRYPICKGCDKFVNLTKQCSACLCFVPWKTLFVSQKCPEGKW
jgi:hypothetical protein